VERSDLDDFGMVPEDAINGFEEFDEGLDDADLLAFASDAVVPETQFNNELEQSNRMEQTQPHIGLSTNPLAQAEFSSSNRNGLPLSEESALLALEEGEVYSPQLLSSQDGNDECSVDDGDEEEMLKLPEAVTGVTERFKPPSSLHCIFEDAADSEEVYDKSLQFSPPKRSSTVSPRNVVDKFFIDNDNADCSPKDRSEQEMVALGDDEDWGFIRSNDVTEIDENRVMTDPEEGKELAFPGIPEHRLVSVHLPSPPQSIHALDPALVKFYLDDSHEYEPVKRFVRPDFPFLIQDRSPIVGVSGLSFLRVCFRIGELFREGVRCEALKQDTVIELFARVTFSSREPGTTKQHFQFADLWNDNPPFPNGVLMNYKAMGLAENESRVFVHAGESIMARCLGRLKRDRKSNTGWLLHIINIRQTDWEEIRWTKRIVSAGLIKSERMEQNELQS